jgi:hypothetical protein
MLAPTKFVPVALKLVVFPLARLRVTMHPPVTLNPMGFPVAVHESKAVSAPAERKPAFPAPPLPLSAAVQPVTVHADPVAMPCWAFAFAMQPSTRQPPLTKNPENEPPKVPLETAVQLDTWQNAPMLNPCPLFPCAEQATNEAPVGVVNPLPRQPREVHA